MKCFFSVNVFFCEKYTENTWTYRDAENQGEYVVGGISWMARRTTSFGYVAIAFSQQMIINSLRIY